jgi:hypothetical protein
MVKFARSAGSARPTKVISYVGAVRDRASKPFWAFRYHGVLPENLEGAIFGHSLKTYGWVYLVVAAVIWSLTYVGIGALVIFALAVYGGEAEAG